MRMSSAMPSTFADPGTAHLCFSETSPAGATPNGSHLYLYLTKGQEKVVKDDDHSSTFNLWYIELVLIGVR